MTIPVSKEKIPGSEKVSMVSPVTQEPLSFEKNIHLIIHLAS